MTDSVFVVIDSTYEPAARCVVCANAIGPGEGLTVRYGVRSLRFKCPGCLERFRIDPLRYLAGHATDLLSRRTLRLAIERMGLRLRDGGVATRHGR